jgi:hypothetical protein
MHPPFLNTQKAKGVFDIEGALLKATRDTEWLILPVDSVQAIPDEYTSTLDISCVSTFEFFKWASVDAPT